MSIVSNFGRIKYSCLELSWWIWYIYNAYTRWRSLACACVYVHEQIRIFFFFGCDSIGGKKNRSTKIRNACLCGHMRRRSVWKTSTKKSRRRIIFVIIYTPCIRCAVYNTILLLIYLRAERVLQSCRPALVFRTYIPRRNLLRFEYWFIQVRPTQESVQRALVKSISA